MELRDPLTSLFNLLKIDHRRPARLNAGGQWSLRFTGSSHVRFGAVLHGGCWLLADGEPPLRLEAGDGYLLTRGQAYTTCSDPQVEPRDGMPLFRHRHDCIVNVGSAEEVTVVSGRFTFSELSSEMMLSMLPALVHLNASSESGPVLRTAITLLDHETTHDGFGASVVTHHVAQIMLVQALRTVASARSQEPLSGLAAIADPRIGAALASMHAQISRRWTLKDLAQEAGMSRSMFALRFKELTGSAPLEYLLRLRMRAACQALRSGARNVASIGYEIGYQSESAFTNAFKRIMGAPPKAYRTRPDQLPLHRP